MNGQDNVAKCLESSSMNYCQRYNKGDCVNVTATPFAVLEATYDLSSANPSYNKYVFSLWEWMLHK